MIKIHEKMSRGRTRTGWLDSHHTFSFGSFNDPTRMVFGNLRVINEDRMVPGSGFPKHHHQDMDILTLVLSGLLRHEDDQKNVSIIGEGEAQMMLAGTGLAHAEWNASRDQAVHFLQIWLIPDHTGGQPHYAQTMIPTHGNVLIAGPSGSGALLPLRSSTLVRLIRHRDGETMDCGRPDLPSFVHLLSGRANTEAGVLSAGDGLEIPAGERLTLNWSTAGEALVFDMHAAATPPASKRVRRPTEDLKT